MKTYKYSIFLILFFYITHLHTMSRTAGYTRLQQYNTFRQQQSHSSNATPTIQSYLAVVNPFDTGLDRFINRQDFKDEITTTYAYGMMMGTTAIFSSFIMAGIFTENKDEVCYVPLLISGVTCTTISAINILRTKLSS